MKASLDNFVITYTPRFKTITWKMRPNRLHHMVAIHILSIHLYIRPPIRQSNSTANLKTHHESSLSKISSCRNNLRHSDKLIACFLELFRKFTDSSLSNSCEEKQPQRFDIKKKHTLSLKIVTHH